MMCCKTSFEMLLACAITSICIIVIDVANGINVHMNENITAVAGEGGIEIKCSYTKENVKTVFTVGLFARNQTNVFVSIVTFLPDDATVITPSGEYLHDRITMTNITQESTEATLIFNEIKCTDQNQYRCKVTYLNTNNDADSKMSPPTTINVTVKPLKPHILSNTSQQNHNINKRSILPSGVINRTSIYQTTSETDHDMSSLTTARIILENKQFPREGDNLTFVCSGNVGRPPGHIMWQIVYMNEKTFFKYVNGTTQSEPFHLKCFLNRTSYLTIQLSANDFNARIRCFVVSHDGNDRLYDDTEPLNFHFGVRNVSINKLPDKQIFDTTIKNITLTCKADGNPKPAYAWYKRKDTNTILSKSNKYVIHNVIKNNSGTYICEVHNFISDEKYNVSTSVEITIENDSSEHKNNNSEMDITLMKWIGIGIAVFAGFVIFALAIYRRCAKRKRLPGGNAKPTSESISNICARDNPGYTSDSETNIDRKKRDCGNEEELKGKQENVKIKIGKPTNQTNNEAASYAYVTVSSDYHKGKETNIGSQEMLMSRINELSSTSSSEYVKENMDEILKNRNEATCDNSPDQYASSVPGIYDALHDNRHKTDNGEQFDRMSELKSLHENRNESHPIHLENSRRVGYESVVIDGKLPFISSENNRHGHDDLEMVRQHNKKYMHNQKQEEENRNKSPVPQQTVEYAQVNEATKFKNKTEHNDKDQPTLDANAETQEVINIKSEKRLQKNDENADQFDTTKKQQINGDLESSNKYNQIGSYINTEFVRKEYKEVDTNTPWTPK